MKRASAQAALQVLNTSKLNIYAWKLQTLHDKLSYCCQHDLDFEFSEKERDFYSILVEHPAQRIPGLWIRHNKNTSNNNSLSTLE